MLIDTPNLYPGRKSIGGMTYQDQPTGSTLRARSQRIFRGTNAQYRLIGKCRQIAAAWTESMTGTQRDDWQTYAMTTLYPTGQGVDQFIAGPAMYRAAMVPRLTAGLPLLLDAPTSAGLGTYTAPLIVFQPDNTIDITIDPMDDWADHDGGVMIITVTSPTTGTSIRQGRQARVIAAYVGSSTTPLPANDSVANPFVNFNLHTQCIGVHVTDDDGRPAVQ